MNTLTLHGLASSITNDVSMEAKALGMTADTKTRIFLIASCLTGHSSITLAAILTMSNNKSLFYTLDAS